MHPTIIPTLRYHDARAAIDWLCDALGFEEHLVVSGDNGEVRHAQLTFGNGMIMLGSARDDEFGKLQAPPDSSDAVVYQSPYIIVSAIDEHYRRAVEAGAKIVMPLTAEDYGGKNYSCRDPEGYLWNFGSYDPWADT
ncbi:MAG: VOC family protein [Pseudomonadota bacterium]